MSFLGKSSLLSSASDGAVDVHNDGGLLFVLWMEFVFNRREGAKKKAAGISHDGAAARRDFVAGEEFVEFAEGTVDGDGRSELGGVADEACGDFGSVAILFELRGVAEAQA